mmetsp:Transcript_68352/g.123182  ORF Transcript_68352/g.123182 Transcript_68352/m.123182 type:complete len:1297 (-) Transcript_68352:133-4023(-)
MSGGSVSSVVFSVHAQTQPGQDVRVVGSAPELGSWDPQRALCLRTEASTYPRWAATVQLQDHSKIEYKFVKGNSHNLEWEDGPNRQFQLGPSGVLRLGPPTAEPNSPRFSQCGGAAPRLDRGTSSARTWPGAKGPIVPAARAPSPPQASQPQPPRPPATSVPGTTEEVRFEVVCTATEIGDVLRIVGSCDALGGWDITRGLRLSTSPAEFPRWSVTVNLPVGGSGFEWKLAIARAAGSTDWEPSANRRGSLPANGKGPWKMRVEYGGSCSSIEPVGSNVCRTPSQSTSSSGGALNGDLKRANTEYGPPATSTKTASSRTSGTLDSLKTLSVAKLSPMMGSVSAEGARRCTSMSLLTETAPLNAIHWGRKREITGPPPTEQVVLLKLKDLTLEEAERLPVEVVFQPREGDDSSFQKFAMKRVDYKTDESKATWSLAMRAAGLKHGVHFCYFLVNGVHTLSQEHLAMEGWNAVLYSEPVRRYILAREGQLLPEDSGQLSRAMDHQVVGAGFKRTITDQGMESEMVRQDSKEPGTRAGNMARPYSICGHLQGLGDSDDEDVPKEDPGSNPSNFAKEVFDGLFDAELLLRTDGLVLPTRAEAPKPPTCATRGVAASVVESLRLWAGAHVLKKAAGACEDAHFIDAHGLGVADGVGCMVQFASYGINAAAYAAELMEFAAAALKPDGVAACTEGSDCESRAAAAMSSAETSAKAYGASTITVLAMEGDRIGVANLGDSGFMLLRKGTRGMTVVHRSEEQQHSWNCPYQLTRLPPALLNRFPKLSLDTAGDSERYSATVKEGDLILMFSDGLRDNLHDREVLHIVDRALSPTMGDLVGLPEHCTPPENIAKALALAAQERSLDPAAKVPFVEYSKRHGFECLGGKQDDITVLAAWVVSDGLAQDGPDGLDLREILGKLLPPATVAPAKQMASGAWGLPNLTQRFENLVSTVGKGYGFGVNAVRAPTNFEVPIKVPAAGAAAVVESAAAGTVLVNGKESQELKDAPSVASKASGEPTASISAMPPPTTDISLPSSLSPTAPVRPPSSTAETIETVATTTATPPTMPSASTAMDPTSTTSHSFAAPSPPPAVSPKSPPVPSIPNFPTAPVSAAAGPAAVLVFAVPSAPQIPGPVPEEPEEPESLAPVLEGAEFAATAATATAEIPAAETAEPDAWAQSQLSPRKQQPGSEPASTSKASRSERRRGGRHRGRSKEAAPGTEGAGSEQAPLSSTGKGAGRGSAGGARHHGAERHPRQPAFEPTRRGSQDTAAVPGAPGANTDPSPRVQHRTQQCRAEFRPMSSSAA